MSKTLQQILRQPEDVRALLEREATQARAAAAVVTNARRVVLTGIGTSYHAAQIGGWLLRAAGLDARAVHAFDLALYPDNLPLVPEDACVVLGHTGNTTLTRAALDRAVALGVPCVAVGATTAEHPGAAVVLRTVEPESSTTYTTSHLAALTGLAMMAAEVAESKTRQIAGELRAALERLPEDVAGMLARASELDPIAAMAAARRTYAIGAGPNEATATELMIKVREAAFCPIDGMAAEQFLHGPMVALNRDDLLVAVHVPGAGAPRVAEIVRTAEAIGARLWVVGRPISGVEASHFALPDAPEVFSPLLALIPMQLLAVKMAALTGANPDEFRTDDPVYGHAFGLLSF